MIIYQKQNIVNLKIGVIIHTVEDEWNDELSVQLRQYYPNTYNNWILNKGQEVIINDLDRGLYLITINGNQKTALLKGLLYVMKKGFTGIYLDYNSLDKSLIPTLNSINTDRVKIYLCIKGGLL